MIGHSGDVEARHRQIQSHSALSRADAIAEARRLGDASPGDSWRRLLWWLADLLEGREE